MQIGRRDFIKYTALSFIAALTAGASDANALVQNMLARDDQEDPASRIIDIEEYKEIIREANETIQNSEFKGSMFVVDYSEGVTTYPEIIDVIEAQAKAVAAQKKALNSVGKEDMVANLMNDVKADTTKFTACSILPESSPKTAAYFAVAFPNFFKKGMTRFSHETTVAHELSHIVQGRDVDWGETQACAERRWESTAGVFSMLYQAQRNRPFLQKNFTRKCLHNVYTAIVSDRFAGMKDGLHDMAPALEAAIADLPEITSEPSFAKAALSDLMKIADGYAKRALGKDYPHLYKERPKFNNNAELETATSSMLERTAEIDKNINIAFSIACEAYINDATNFERLEQKSQLIPYWKKEIEQMNATQASVLARLSKGMARYKYTDKNNLTLTVEFFKKMRPDVFVGDVQVQQRLGQNKPPARHRSLNGSLDNG